METTELTFDQVAREIIFESGPWKPYRDRLMYAETHVRGVSELLTNYYCVLQWGEPYSELLKSDEGMLKLATVFQADCPFDPAFQERRKRAKAENDTAFLDAFNAAMRREAVKLDGRVKNNIKHRTAFLYLNWFLPFLNPELDRGLIVRPLKEIQSLSEQYGHEAVSEKAFEQELRSLKLLPFDESEREKLRDIGLSNFLLPV